MTQIIGDGRLTYYFLGENEGIETDPDLEICISSSDSPTRVKTKTRNALNQYNCGDFK